MTTPKHDYTWPQGADLTIGFRYLVGPKDEEVPVDLTGYTVRMDMAHPETGESLYTFNTEEQEDPDEIFVNAGGTGRVVISVPRALTLPSEDEADASPVYLALTQGVDTFNYDIFLRDPSELQTKVYGGVIRIERSHTLWR